MQWISNSEAETGDFARNFGAKLQPADIVCLRGDLGRGKSVFARELIRSWAGDAALTVPSPTFTLVQTYETAKGSIWHFDLYRLEKPEDVYELGWEEAAGQALCLIEWPERLGPLLPCPHIDIHFRAGQTENSREITVEYVSLDKDAQQ